MYMDGLLVKGIDVANFGHINTHNVIHLTKCSFTLMFNM